MKTQTEQPNPSPQKLKVQANIPRWIPAVLLIIALIGFGDSSYLAFEHITGGTPNCSIVEGCEVVTTSVYSELFGIPVALLGAFYYLTIAALMVAWFDKKKEIVLKLAGWFSWAGLAASAWFVYVQLGILKAICIYCMGSAASSTLIFILGMILLSKMKRPTENT